MRIAEVVRGSRIKHKLVSRVCGNRLHSGSCWWSPSGPIVRRFGLEPHTYMPSNDRAILKEQFLNQPGDKHPERWDDLWKKNCTPWDRKGPSLALSDTITHNPDLFGRDGKRKKALVPGCGRGYDVLLLSSLGYDTLGVDASETALEEARKVQSSSSSSLDAKGEIQFLLADFFKPLPSSSSTFDLIFDYTFLCALPPELRPSWAKRVSELLAPEGKLVCLEWPLGKPPKEGGPPHGLTSELYVELFARPGEEVKYDEEGVVVKEAGRERSEGSLERVKHFMPERTHEAGKGKDYVSIWKHASS